MTNSVCVPKKRNLSIVPLEMVRSLAQEEGVDPYHLDLVLLPLFFLIPSRVLLLPISNRTC